ncbi:transcriptional regulator [Rhodomicrobium udaipurense]|uniref:Transcriptional regulator n=1 Tax=Rhodomicrobium udaipurense TaxID=1202716 RepID=A0A8I1KL48_9HYPH|nr:transcriptional regulator [Rhodomicrobium udaipurense]MBJ7545006.1 transcriptional regulator [Rhodomicrobium udaipurense]
MSTYRYTECGLDNVIIQGVEFVTDDNGEEVVSIPNVNGLHKAIAEGILLRQAGMSGKELRFIRTEMGMTQAELAGIVNREPLSVSRWERGETPIDHNAQALIRLIAIQRLEVETDASAQDIAGWCVPSAGDPPILIDGHNPDDYCLAA